MAILSESMIFRENMLKNVEKSQKIFNQKHLNNRKFSEFLGRLYVEMSDNYFDILEKDKNVR